jgi:hypothetical protein
VKDNRFEHEFDQHRVELGRRAALELFDENYGYKEGRLRAVTRRRRLGSLYDGDRD